MTRRIGNVVIIEVEQPQQCDYCGAIGELRPYGRDGAKICFPCSRLPENVDVAKAAMAKLFGLHQP
jgi:hypothetical protein